MSLDIQPVTITKPAVVAKPGSVRRGFWWAVALFVAPLLVCELGLLSAMANISSNETPALLVYSGMGLIVAQGCVLCVAHVLSANQLLHRTAAAWGWGLAAMVAWTVGALTARIWASSWMVPNLDAFVAMLCLVPFITLAVQAPLWIARLIFGWRIVRADREHSAATPLTDFFLLTALVAATFALVNLSRYLLHSNSGQFWPVIGVVWGIVAAVSLAALVPLVCLALRRESTALAWLFAIVAAALAALTTYLIAGLFGRRLPPWTWEMTGITVAYFSITCGVCLGLTLIHRHGYRLRWGNEHI